MGRLPEAPMTSQTRPGEIDPAPGMMVAFIFFSNESLLNHIIMIIIFTLQFPSQSS